MKKSLKYLTRNQLVVLLTTLILAVAAPVLSQWQSAPGLKTPRRGAAAVALDSFIYVLGGATTNNIVLNTVERFDPATQQWDSTFVPPFSVERVDAAAGIYEGKIYLMGGRDSHGNVTDSVEVYDPVSNSWSATANMKTGREGLAATLVFGKICAMGGLDGDGNFAEKIEWFTGSEWRESTTDIFTPRVAPFLASRGDTVYMFGGINIWPSDTGFGAQVSTGWFFNWFVLPPLSVERGGGAAVMLQDRMYMMGGSSLGGVTDVVEVYDPLANYMDITFPMVTERTNFPAVTYNDTIFVFGGYNNDPAQPLSSVEKYVIIFTGIPGPGAAVPTTYLQVRGYPNPFNGQVSIESQVRSTGNYRLTIFDVNGRTVRHLIDGKLLQGRHEVLWNATDNGGNFVGSGIYFAVLEGRYGRAVTRLVYIR